MKIADYDLVGALLAARHALEHKRVHGRLALTIDGLVQDGELVECIRRSVEAELYRRRDNLDEQLRSLGVDPD